MERGQRTIMIHQPGVEVCYWACVYVCLSVCVCVDVLCIFSEWLVVINGLSLGWENINPKLNLDELPQIDKPQGKQNTRTHTQFVPLSLWGPTKNLFLTTKPQSLLHKAPGWIIFKYNIKKSLFLSPTLPVVCINVCNVLQVETQCPLGGGERDRA